MKDGQRPLNLSHEYQLVFLESNDFSTNQLVLKTGTILGGGGAANPDTLQLFGNVNANPPQVLFSTPFTPGVFNNFAVTLDFNKLCVTCFLLSLHLILFLFSSLPLPLSSPVKLPPLTQKLAGHPKSSSLRARPSSRP